MLTREQARWEAPKLDLPSNLSAFIRAAWPIVEPAQPYVHGWHIDCISEHLQAIDDGEIRNLIINIPPRHMKSLSVAVFWPVWTWTHSPSTRWLFASYAESLSIRDSLKCRRLIQSKWYQERWGGVYRLAGDQNVKGRFDNDKMGYRLASSVGGSITGEGGDRLIADDPHNVKEAESDAMREGVILWWDEVMSTRLNNPLTGARVVVMQRVHEDDLTGHLLERGGYHHLCLPVEYEKRFIVEVSQRPEHQQSQPHDDCAIAKDPRADEGELLWPDRMPREALDELKLDLGPYGSAGQLQQRPVPRAGAVFRSEWFQPLPSGFDTLDADDKTPRQRLRTVMFWDLAWSELESADYTAALTMGVNADKSQFYILDVWRQRIDKQRLDEELAAHILRLRPSLVGVEEGAFKQAATRDLIRNVNAILARERMAVGVLAIKADRDKVTRAQLPAGRAKGMQLFADRMARWWHDFEIEALGFPRQKHDDQVDALSGAMQLAIEKLGDSAQPQSQSYLMGKAAHSDSTQDEFTRWAFGGGKPTVIRRRS